ncbi:hypothetical protein FACS1894216_21390 [Synergistales bacterium]|nr:hypothetical protein FACS1894216_21390 [Synergistales bacterium]
MSYKNRDKAEQGFKFLKQPLYPGPIYTKKASRAEAPGYIFLLVLLLAKYLEYRVRVSMTQSGHRAQPLRRYRGEKYLCCLAASGGGLAWGAMVMELGNFGFCETVTSNL